MRDEVSLSARRTSAPASRRVWRALASMLVALPLLTACRGGDGDDAASTTVAPSAPLLGAGDEPISAPETLPLPPGYEPDDTRNVELRPAMGRLPDAPPPAPVLLTGGSSRLTGLARGPDGPVPGATVRIERFVEDRSASVDVTAGSDGRFALGGLPGGRYRVRAWLRPFLTATQSAVTFLAAVGGAADLVLDLERRNAVALFSSVSVRGWQVGDPAGVSVLVTQEYVDQDGIARTGGVSGTTVTLQPSGGVGLLSEPSAVTGNDGYARFGVQCTSAGPVSLRVDAAGLNRAVPLPVCVEPPPPTTAPPPEPGPAVGQVVAVPSAGPYAAGTYVADGDPGRCRTTFEVQVDGAWQREAGGGVLQARGPVRSLQPAPGSTPCPYRRTA